MINLATLMNKNTKLPTLLILLLIVGILTIDKCNTPSVVTDTEVVSKEELETIKKQLLSDLQKVSDKEKAKLEKKINRLSTDNAKLLVLNKELSTKNNTVLKTKTIIKEIYKNDTTYLYVDRPTYINTVLDSIEYLNYKQCCEFSKTQLSKNFLSTDTTFFDGSVFVVSEIYTKGFPVLHKDFTIHYPKFVNIETKYNNLYLHTGFGFNNEPIIPLGISYDNDKIMYRLNLHLQDFNNIRVGGFDATVGLKITSW